jgi:hypothetical protein
MAGLAEAKSFVELRSRPKPSNGRRRPTPETALLRAASGEPGQAGESYSDVILRLATGRGGDESTARVDPLENKP